MANERRAGMIVDVTICTPAHRMNAQDPHDKFPENNHFINQKIK